MARLLLALTTATALGACEVVVRPDQMQVTEDQTVVLDLTANDDGVETASLDFGQRSRHGTLREIGKGKVEYTPDHDFVGQDSFIYSGQGPRGSDTAKVTIDVVEDLPRFSHLSLPLSRRPTDVTTGDFDGDGLLDVAVLQQREALTVFLQTSANLASEEAFRRLEFEPLVPDEAPPTLEGLARLATFDLEHDARSELIFASRGVGVVVMRYMDSEGTFEALTMPVSGVFPSQLAVADLNDNGLPDLLLAEDSFQSLQLLLDLQAEGQRLTATAPFQLPTSSLHAHLLSFDFDKDGSTNFLVDDGDSDFVTAYAFRDGAPSRELLAFSSSVLSLSPRDQDRDGMVDAIVSDSLQRSRLFVGSDADWAPWAASTAKAALCDVNDDGRTELVLLDAGGVVRFWSETMPQPLTFAPAGDFVMASQVALAVTAADLDGDGATDVVTAGARDLDIAWAHRALSQ